MRTTCLRRSRCSTADLSPAASYETLETGHRVWWQEQELFARAKWQLFAGTLASSHLLKAVGCALQGCSYLLPPLPVAGKASSSPHTEQQPGMQCRASGLVLTRGVLNMSIIEVFRGRWRKAFLAHGLAVCCIGKGMAPGHGSRKRLLCGGAVRTAGHSTLGSCRTGREVPRQWW